ncbi:hypothetical protein D9611_009689 [Ephemerocybe angulata]|uniref:Uncharacterized protein n=1 Tax=Ephemerocybe angulata TaxID=980116 RepID=A0A8H5C725_9AGAR|nr:hypothetical protein D9611_009689 [Tulosesus angulatus]
MEPVLKSEAAPSQRLNVLANPPNIRIRATHESHLSNLTHLSFTDSYSMDWNWAPLSKLCSLTHLCIQPPYIADLERIGTWLAYMPVSLLVCAAVIHGIALRRMLEEDRDGSVEHQVEKLDKRVLLVPQSPLHPPPGAEMPTWMGAAAFWARLSEKTGSGTSLEIQYDLFWETVEEELRLRTLKTGDCAASFATQACCFL